MYKSKKTAILFITPLLVFMFVFLLFPFLINVKNSFYKITLAFDTNAEFIGFDNYLAVFNDSRFHYAIVNTFILMGLVIIFQVGFSLFLALLVNRVGKMQVFYKVSYFLPIIISGAAIGLIFHQFYRYSGNPARQGAFNQILIFLKMKPIQWIDSRGERLPILMAMSAPVVWQYIGFYFVIFLTGLSTISDDLLEAASIDGANDFQKVFKIEIPMLRNIIRVVFVLAITGTLKVFDLPHILNASAWPLEKNYFLGTLLNYYRLTSSKQGVAAAFAVILVLFGIVMSAISNTIFKQNKDI